LRLTLVGCSGSVGSPRSVCSSYLLQADQGSVTTSLLLDVGSGALGELQRYVSPHRLSAVLLSHLHADHVVDTAGLAAYWCYVPGPEHPRQLPLWGPEGTPQRVSGLCDTPQLAEEAYDYRSWVGGESIRIGPFEVTPYPARHPVPAFSMRITGPTENGTGRRTVVYTGDTDTCSSVVEAASEAELLLCEASHQEDRDAERGTHLTGRRAGELAERSGARQLVLTHIPPWTSRDAVLIEASAAYDGPVELAEPGRTFVL
jgi:ribonuclease BN (tRNA processing enzyme)